MTSFFRATIDDLETLVEQRMTFMRDSHPETDYDMLREPLRRYYAETIPTGECIYWLAADKEADERKIIGGGGMALRRYAPGYLLRDGVSAYVFNIFTEEAYRKQGVAREIMLRLMQEAKERGIARLDLHATEMGRSVYEKLGFEPPDHVYLEWETK